MEKPSRKSLPKRVNDMSKGELEEALKKKKECNAKALQIVENMLENPISEDWFIDNLKYIRQTHFDDIVEERSILKICGYPLCSGMIKKVPAHQYHISARLNKVYDTTERKKYCSNQCYRAGKYLKDQLLSSPLWFSGYEDIPNFKLLPINSVGMIGEEVDLGRGSQQYLIESCTEEFEFMSINQIASESLNEIPLETVQKSSNGKSPNTLIDPHSKNETVQETCKILNEATDSNAISNTVPVQVMDKSIKLEHSMPIVPQQLVQTSFLPSSSREETHNAITGDKMSTRPIVVKTTDNVSIPENKKTEVIKENEHIITKDVSSNHKADNRRTDRNVNHSHRRLKPTVHKPDITGSMGLVLHVETCLREWFNLETMIFLFGEHKVKEMIVEKGKSIREYYKVVSNASRDPKLQERYESICKRLNLMELEDSHYDQNATAAITELKPLPDYRVIQEEGLKLEMKINAFYQGKITYVEDVSSVEVVSKGDELAVDPLLPLVDTHAQRCYRRKIVQDRLSKVLPDLLRTYGLASRDINDEFRALVRTFSLEAHNIFFKPAEWNLLGLVIINMLAIKDLQLKSVLATEQAKNYRTLMLIPYQQEGDYIDKLMSWLTDIDNLVDSEKQTENIEPQ